MFNKLFYILPAICLLTFTGCENSDDSDVNTTYPFADVITVGSVSTPITGADGDVAQIDDAAGNYIVMVKDGLQLQRLKPDRSGYYDIPGSDYTIIKPGDVIQFGYTMNHIDYSVRPPVVRPDLIRVEK